jgi:nicotinamidase-related amidase
MPPHAPADLRPPAEGACALVVIDIQEKLAPAMETAALNRCLRAARTLLEVARWKKWRVVATEQYPKGLGKTIPEIVPELSELGGLPALEKTAFSAAGADGFAERLGPEVKAAVLVGMEAHVCVHETALDLLGRGLTVFVPWDGVASRREEDRSTALASLREAGAIITSSETLAFQAAGRAGTAEFKAISARVR